MWPVLTLVAIEKIELSKTGTICLIKSVVALQKRTGTLQYFLHALKGRNEVLNILQLSAPAGVVLSSPRTYCCILSEDLVLLCRRSSKLACGK